MQRRVRGLVRGFLVVTKQAEFWSLLFVPVILVMVLLVFLGGERNQAEAPLRTNLSETSEVSPVQQISGGSSSPASDDSLRVAISGVLSPTKTLEHYQELLAYMGQELGKEVALFQKPTYAELNDLVRGQRVDVAFVCSLAYVIGNRDFGMELLVAAQMNGETVYYSYLIVAEESNAVSLEDLMGSSFAFTDPLSNSGHLAPNYQLSLLGETPVSFFRSYVFTHSHDNSITAVSNKLVDAAAVDSLIYDQIIEDNPELAAKTKVIARWGPYGIPPVVVNPALDPQLKQQLQDFFLNLHKSSEGSRILDSLGIDRFVVIPDDIYESIREMEAKLGW